MSPPAFRWISEIAGEIVRCERACPDPQGSGYDFLCISSRLQFVREQPTLSRHNVARDASVARGRLGLRLEQIQFRPSIKVGHLRTPVQSPNGSKPSAP
jgi:hypothetical protein